MATKVKVHASRHWFMEDIRELCIKHNLYTAGDSRQYSRMLWKITELDPTPKSIYKIAENIVDHSDPETVGTGYDAITNVMFLIENEAVKTWFSIEEVEK